jgi:citrate synthase
MTNLSTDIIDGLEGVVVAATRLSDVDGAQGRLIIAGHDAERLAEGRSFEEVCGLLWGQDAPALGEARAEVARALPLAALSLGDAMDALRASVAHLREEAAAPARVTAAAAVFLAAHGRMRRGLPPVPPDPALGHAADLLRMLTGEPPDEARARALERYLITVSDHGMNASTFAARVVASTGSDLISAVVAALGALKGPLHGGAPGPVLDMLDAIGAPERAEAWLLGELAAGRRIMGMGHRIYRVRDPRAAVLERATLELERAGVSTGRLALARAVEQAALGVLAARYPGRSLCANVEFYTAVLLDTVGIPRELFTATFAAGRVAGWAGHVLEQRATGRLIRPASRYIGPAPA